MGKEGGGTSRVGSRGSSGNGHIEGKEVVENLCAVLFYYVITRTRTYTYTYTHAQASKKLTHALLRTHTRTRTSM